LDIGSHDHPSVIELISPWTLRPLSRASHEKSPNGFPWHIRENEKAQVFIPAVQQLSYPATHRYKWGSNIFSKTQSLGINVEDTPSMWEILAGWLKKGM